MKLYIPAIGELIQLTSDWTFVLHNESRNHTLMTFVNDPREQTYYGSLSDPLPCTIPAGAILSVDRIYIKKGAPEFDSMTFRWKGMSTQPSIEQDWKGNDVKVPRKPVRFWAKLKDVNNIEFDHVQPR